MGRNEFNNRRGLKKRRKTGTIFTSTYNPAGGWRAGKCADTAVERGETSSAADQDDQRREIDDEAPTYTAPMRLCPEIFELEKHPNDENQVLPSRLRPRQRSPCELETVDKLNNVRLQGNFIMNMRLVEDHFNDAIVQHIASHPSCKGKITADPTQITKCGWVIASVLHCRVCRFETAKCKFYEEEDGKVGRGRRAAKVNKQMSVAITKQPCATTTFTEVMASCDIMPASTEGMRKSNNKAADYFVELNRRQLAENRKKVKDIIAIRTGDRNKPLMVQLDAAYNNSAKGRSFAQVGTMVCGPLFCSEPGLQAIPLALATASKLCTCPDRHTGHHLKICQRNFAPERPIGNAEYDLGRACGEELMSGGDDSAIQAGIVVTDGVGPGQLFKGINSATTSHDYEPCINQDCARHISSGLRRGLRKLTLTSVYRTGTVAQRKKKEARLLDFISKRCTHEFRTLHRRFGKDACRQVKSKVRRGEDRHSCVHTRKSGNLS